MSDILPLIQTAADKIVDVEICSRTDPKFEETRSRVEAVLMDYFGDCFKQEKEVSDIYG